MSDWGEVATRFPRSDAGTIHRQPDREELP